MSRPTDLIAHANPKNPRLGAVHLLLIDDARRGLADIAAGRSFEADEAIAQIQQRRASARSAKGAAMRRLG